MKNLLMICLISLAFPSWGQDGYNKYTAPGDTRTQQEQERRRLQAEAYRRESQNAQIRSGADARRAADEVRGNCRIETSMIGELTRCKVCPGEPTVCWQPDPTRP